MTNREPIATVETSDPEFMWFQFWPHGKPLPDDAMFATTLGGSHGQWSVLIERIMPPEAA